MSAMDDVLAGIVELVGDISTSDVPSAVSPSIRQVNVPPRMAIVEMIAELMYSTSEAFEQVRVVPLKLTPVTENGGI